MSYMSSDMSAVWFGLDIDELPYDLAAEKKAALNMVSAAVHIALSYAEPDEVLAVIDRTAWLNRHN